MTLRQMAGRPIDAPAATRQSFINLEKTLNEFAVANPTALENAATRKKDASVNSSEASIGEETGPGRLPDSAELKLIRAAQLRVNRRTAELDLRRNGGPLNDELKEEADAIAARQAQVIEMARKVMEKQSVAP